MWPNQPGLKRVVPYNPSSFRATPDGTALWCHLLLRLRSAEPCLSCPERPARQDAVSQREQLSQDGDSTYS